MKTAGVGVAVALIVVAALARRATAFRRAYARLRGEIRSGPSAAWMPFTAEQFNFYDPASRYFLMKAARAVVPFQAFHVYSGTSATMRVRLASLVTMVNAHGPEMDVAETVTLLNDMCVFAPATLVDANVVWRTIDAHTVAAAFTNAGHTIGATLRFDDEHRLVDFVSDDRFASSDGKHYERMRWSTPLGNYRVLEGRRVAAHGEGKWHAATGEYAYIRLEVESIEYNPRRSSK